MKTDTSSFPSLPPELEHIIFVFALENAQRDAGRLLLVAKRVFDWLIPHVYNVVILSHTSNESNEIEEMIYQRYGHHVRQLFIDSTIFRRYLPLFPNVTNLAFWAPIQPTDITIFRQLPLNRISTQPSSDLFEVFAKVTHLDLVSDSLSDVDLKRLLSKLSLPRVTHLCVADSLSDAEVEWFLDRRRYPQLKLLVLWSWGIDEPMLVINEGELVHDKRVVVLESHPESDWERGARGELDMWKFAEGVVASR